MGKVVMRNLPGGVDESEWRTRVGVAEQPCYLVRPDGVGAGVPYTTAYVQLRDGDEPAFVAKWDALRWVGSDGEVSRCSVEMAVYQSMPLPVEEQAESAEYGDTFRRFCKWKRGEVASMVRKKKDKGGKTPGGVAAPLPKAGSGSKPGKKAKEKARAKGPGNGSQTSTTAAPPANAPGTKAPVAVTPTEPSLAKKHGEKTTKKRGGSTPGTAAGMGAPQPAGKTSRSAGNTPPPLAGKNKPGSSRKSVRGKSRSAGATPDPVLAPEPVPRS